MWSETSTGYTTSDPDEIAAFCQQNGIGQGNSEQSDPNGEDPPKGAPSVEKKTSLARQFLDGTPVIGKALSSGDKLNEGDYAGATIDFAYSLFEMFTLGYCSEIDFGKSLVARTADELSVNGSSKVMMQFGKTQDQIYHTFRHTDALGLDRKLVQSAIETDFNTVSTKAIEGKPFNQTIEVDGQKIQYATFKFSDGTFNIG